MSRLFSANGNERKKQTLWNNVVWENIITIIGVNLSLGVYRTWITRVEHTIETYAIPETTNYNFKLYIIDRRKLIS